MIKTRQEMAILVTVCFLAWYSQKSARYKSVSLPDTVLQQPSVSQFLSHATSFHFKELIQVVPQLLVNHQGCDVKTNKIATWLW